MIEPASVVISNYAYLMSWNEYYSPKALNKLLSSGIRVKVAMQKFNLNGKNYEYGTLLIPVAGQTLNSSQLINFI